MRREELLKRYANGDRDFRGAYLRGAYLDGANLRGAYLCGADLRGANLRGANLRGANLDGAYLDGAYLCGADLRGAYLCGADLRGANLDGAYLDGAEWHETRLHPLSTWSEEPPRCSVGDWHAICVAPGVVRIGCKELTVEVWLDYGACLIEENGVRHWESQMLRHFLLSLPSEPDGWVPDAEDDDGE